MMETERMPEEVPAEDVGEVFDKKLPDGRSPEEKKIDDDYNAMISRVLGPDAVEEPLRNFLGGFGLGGASVAVDTADTGYHFHAPLDDSEVDCQVQYAREAIRVAYSHTPIGNSEPNSAIEKYDEGS